MTTQLSLMRVMRGGFALWAFWEVYQTGEWLLMIPGVIFGLQAILNVGCFGSAGCAVPHQQNAAETTENVVYEEVR